MTTKSPTSVRAREIIGVDQFSQRREVFGQHDTVFLPLPSPTTMLPRYNDTEPVVTYNHGKPTSNFKRNTPGYSSMRESRTEDRNIEFRARKYSDNFTSELNQSDDEDYRHSMNERNRRLSKLRRDFLNSNLHEPSNENSFTRSGTRASMPVGHGSIKYKIESPNLYKFPFAERVATPPPVRRVVIDLGPPELNGEKENQDPEPKPKHQSLPNSDTSPKIDHQKLFEELVKRYSPQRKPVNWNLPPTRPRVVGSVPKSTSSAADSIDSTDKKVLEESIQKLGDDDVFAKKENNVIIDVFKEKEDISIEVIKDEANKNTEVTHNGPEILSGEVKIDEKHKDRDSKVSLAELEEKNDHVPELSTMQRLSKDAIPKRPSLEKFTDVTIPDLLEKMSEEAQQSEKHKVAKKVKRKRSFLDKLLGRKKDK